MPTFSGATVAITGVGRTGQVGEALALAFAQQGAKVLLVGHSANDVEARAKELLSDGHDATGYECDLADGGQVSALASRVAREHGARIDALVNAAGGFAMSGPVAESDPSVAARQMQINFTTAYLVTRAFLPAVRTAQGAVVFFASEAVLMGANTAGMSGYVAAKSAVVGLMRAVAVEEAPSVRANAVAPSAIRTTANLQSMGEGRLLSREAVAQAVMYLCSRDASAVTGQVIHLT